MKIHSVIHTELRCFVCSYYTNISILMEDKITISCLDILCLVHIREYRDQKKSPEKIPYSYVFSRVLIIFLIQDVFSSVSFRNLWFHSFSKSYDRNNWILTKQKKTRFRTTKLFWKSSYCRRWVKSIAVCLMN